VLNELFDELFNEV